MHSLFIQEDCRIQTLRVLFLDDFPHPPSALNVWIFIIYWLCHQAPSHPPICIHHFILDHILLMLMQIGPNVSGTLSPTCHAKVSQDLDYHGKDRKKTRKGKRGPSNKVPSLVQRPGQGVWRNTYWCLPAPWPMIPPVCLGGDASDHRPPSPASVSNFCINLSVIVNGL